jgi:hypothetical protein
MSERRRLPDRRPITPDNGARETEILAAYSTPGLRRNQLSRGAKKEHLRSLRVPEADIEKILDELYPTEMS